MRKIIAFILCLMILCVPVVASAEGGEDISTPVVETPVEEEIQPPTETTPTFEEEVELMSEQIEEWLLSNAEEISVIVTLISTCLVVFMRLKTVIKTTGVSNNNSITIAKSSNEAIAKALAEIEAVSSRVIGYEDRIATLLEAFKTTAEDKQKLEAELVEIKNYLNTSSKSNLEFADELAELLGLANIPNYKKEELGARHVAAKKAIIDAEAKAEATAVAMIPTTTEEVKEDVGEEA